MKYEVFKYLSSDTINILLFVFSDDWICVAPASNHNLKSIAAITEGEEDSNITASLCFKEYFIEVELWKVKKDSPSNVNRLAVAGQL